MSPYELFADSRSAVAGSGKRHTVRRIRYWLCRPAFSASGDQPAGMAGVDTRPQLAGENSPRNNDRRGSRRFRPSGTTPSACARFASRVIRPCRYWRGAYSGETDIGGPLGLVKRLKQGENENIDLIAPLKSGRVAPMDKEQVVSKLREYEPELKAAGIVHLRIFGSVARGDAASFSDVDLLADFDKSKCFTLVSVGRLENRLKDILGVKVDLSSPDWMREPVRTRALREAVLAF
jgi:uncharacterized protein